MLTSLSSFLAVFGAVFAVIFIGLWFFISYCTVRIGRKVGVSGGGMDGVGAGS